MGPVPNKSLVGSGQWLSWWICLSTVVAVVLIFFFPLFGPTLLWPHLTIPGDATPTPPNQARTLTLSPSSSRRATQSALWRTDTGWPARGSLWPLSMSLALMPPTSSGLGETCLFRGVRYTAAARRCYRRCPGNTQAQHDNRIAFYTTRVRTLRRCSAGPWATESTQTDGD